MHQRPKHPKPAARGRLRGGKSWLPRLVLLIGTPLLFFGLLELVLRLAGFGHPTAFLLRSTNQAQKTFVQNNQFGWRFFGPRMARTPHPFSISQTKAPDTVRIFVFGESAAYGDPQPHFGLPRVLQALLSLRHPGVHFEVVNAAMTGINSHVIVPVARDCARANGDLWVIYMGNNEVVGPFGAGTVFGPQAPPVPVVRASLALKATRTGQFLDTARQWFQKPPPEKSEWGGMLMFLDQQVRVEDSRMTNVCRNFEKNLADIIQAGHDSGVGIVVSTVAVNLRDCAPFGSQHRPGLSAPEKTQWEQFYQRGMEAWQAENFPVAAEQFGHAAQVDDAVAELQFRLGECALKLGAGPQAQRHFLAARDLDTLRFRCDSRLNEVIRRVASRPGMERVLLADAEKIFAEHSPDGLPGADLFYEHVHPTFAGNFLLAQTIAVQLEKLLPEKVQARVPAQQPSPTLEDCARQLAWSDQDWLAALSEVLTRLTDPPFTAQINHDAQMRHLASLAQSLAAANSPAAQQEALRRCEKAVAAWPEDAELLDQLASLKQSANDLPGAEAAEKRSLDLLPSDTESWARYGLILAQQQKYEAAVPAFRRAFELDPQNVWALQNLAQSLIKLNRRDEAAHEYRRALVIKPRFGLAWLGLGQLLEERGHKAEAEDCFQKALANRVRRAPDLILLARFCQSRGWFEAAATNFADAIQLKSSDPVLRFEAGQSLAALGRREAAAQRFEEAVRLSPDWAEAHFLYGLELGRAGRTAEATREFREAARLLPELIEARLNLGIALSKQGQLAEALEEFQFVTRRNPTNALARQYIEAVHRKMAAESAR